MQGRIGRCAFGDCDQACPENDHDVADPDLAVNGAFRARAEGLESYRLQSHGKLGNAASHVLHKFLRFLIESIERLSRGRFGGFYRFPWKQGTATKVAAAAVLCALS